MAIADAPARSGAQTAIRLSGRPVTYVRAGEPTTNLSTGVVTPSETTASLKAVLTRIRHELVDGTLIRATDQMLLVDAVSFEAAFGAGQEPEEVDRVEVGSRSYAIVKNLPVSSGEQWALHKLIVRW